MKIRVVLFESDEDLERTLKKTEERGEIPKELAKELRREELKKAYLELDTGGQFDELPEESKEALKKLLRLQLQRFFSYVLAGIHFDLAIRLASKGKLQVMPGFHAIEAGLEKMSEELEAAQLISKKYFPD